MKWHTATTRSRATLVSAALSTVALISLAGCTSAAPGPESSGTAGSGKCKNVTALITDMQNPWDETMANGMQDQAKKLGVNLTVQDAAQTVATQASQLQQAVTAKSDGIILQAVESDGLVPAVKLANNASIPVVTVNATIGDGAHVVTFVGVDQKDYGVALAKLAESAIPNGGKVAIIEGPVGNPVEVDRTKGINETFAANPSIDVVTTVTDSWTNAGNLAAVQDLLAKYPKGQLDVVVAEGPEMYVGARYAKKIKRDDVKFISGDFPIEVNDAIKSGDLYGTTLQDGGAIGARSLTDLCNHIAGKTVSSPTDFLKIPAITSDNVSQYKTTWHW